MGSCRPKIPEWCYNVISCVNWLIFLFLLLLLLLFLELLSVSYLQATRLPEVRIIIVDWRGNKKPPCELSSTEEISTLTPVMAVTIHHGPYRDFYFHDSSLTAS